MKKYYLVFNLILVLSVSMLLTACGKSSNSLNDASTIEIEDEDIPEAGKDINLSTVLVTTAADSDTPNVGDIEESIDIPEGITEYINLDSLIPGDLIVTEWKVGGLLNAYNQTVQFFTDLNSTFTLEECLAYYKDNTTDLTINSDDENTYLYGTFNGMKFNIVANQLENGTRLQILIDKIPVSADWMKVSDFVPSEYFDLSEDNTAIVISGSFGDVNTSTFYSYLEPDRIIELMVEQLSKLEEYKKTDIDDTQCLIEGYQGNLHLSAIVTKYSAQFDNTDYKTVIHLESGYNYKWVIE